MPAVGALVRSVHNIRDLAECATKLKPGQVFRCALPHEITDDDVVVLREQLGVAELIDLRTSEEQQDDAGGAKLWEGGRFVRYTRSLFTCQMLTARVLQQGPAPITLHHVSFLERVRFYQGLIYKVPFASILYAITLRLFGSVEWRTVLVKEVNARGLALLYEILLDGAQVEILTAVRLVAKAVQEQKPVMFFCRAGKDRTGMLAMLVLAACGTSRESIIADYHRSDEYHMVALAGIEKRPELAQLDRQKFQGAPKEAIVSALQYLDENYGGPQAYLDTIGFTYEQQNEMRKLLTID